MIKIFAVKALELCSAIIAIGTITVSAMVTGGYNYVRDGLMGGNDELYYMTDTASTLGATVGTIYCAYANDICITRWNTVRNEVISTRY